MLLFIIFTMSTSEQKHQRATLLKIQFASFQKNPVLCECKKYFVRWINSNTFIPHLGSSLLSSLTSFQLSPPPLSLFILSHILDMCNNFILHSFLHFRVFSKKSLVCRKTTEKAPSFMYSSMFCILNGQQWSGYKGLKYL